MPWISSVSGPFLGQNGGFGSLSRRFGRWSLGWTLR